MINAGELSDATIFFSIPISLSVRHPEDAIRLLTNYSHKKGTMSYGAALFLSIFNRSNQQGQTPTTQYMKILPVINSSFQTLEHIINIMQAGTWEWNIQTGIVRVNRFWYAMLGYDEAEPEMSMQAWQDMIHHDDIQHVMDAVHEHLSGGTAIYQSEFRLRNRDGGWVWVQAKGKIVEYDNNRSPLYFSGTHIDITKQKTDEDALLAANSKYRFLCRNTSDAILFLKNGIIVEGNPGAFELFGCKDISPLLDKHPAMISPEYQPDGSESRQKAEAHMQSAASGEPQCFEWVHTRINGESFLTEVHLQHIPAYGEGSILALVRTRNKQLVQNG